MDPAALRALFHKPYGSPPPGEEQWRALYAEDVHFQDPLQERHGLDDFIAAQEGLIRRCDDVRWVARALAIEADIAFLEWEMGLRIKGLEFTYEGTTRLTFNSEGKVSDHRDYFDFVGPTFAPIPVLGGVVRWLYRRFEG